MLPDWVSNPGPLTYESGALPIALRGPAADSVPRGVSHEVIIFCSGACIWNVRWDGKLTGIGFWVQGNFSDKCLIYADSLNRFNNSWGKLPFEYWSYHENICFMYKCISLECCGSASWAQSVGHLTRKSEVLGSIPGLVTYFRFSFRWFKKGSFQLLAKVHVCARSTG